MAYRYSLEELITCAGRELAMRERVYPERVSAGRMKREEMAREIALMRSIQELLQAERERRLAAQQAQLFTEIGRPADQDGWNPEDHLVSVRLLGQDQAVTRIVEHHVWKHVISAPELKGLESES